MREGVYGFGEDIDIEVTFGEVVHVTDTTGDLALTLSIGDHSREAGHVGGSGTDTLTFRYTVQDGDYDGDGISISPGPGSLQGGRIEDDAGNAVVRTFPGLAANGAHMVDGISPSLMEVDIVSDPGVLGLNEEIKVKVVFGEVVHVTDTMGDLALVLSIGKHLRSASFDGGSGTETPMFVYTVQAGDYDDDGISIGPNALQGGTIVDTAGNEVVRNFEGLPADERYTVDSMTDPDAPLPTDPSLLPTVSDVKFMSDPGPNTTYTTGDPIVVHVIFSNYVYVTGEPPVLKLSIGSMLRDAVFEEGSGTTTLKFQYTVEAGDTDDDGISIGPNALVGAVEDGSGNTVDLTLPPLQAQGSPKVSAELRLYPLALTLVVGQAQTINLADLLLEMGVTYRGDFERASDDPNVAKVDLSDRMLTITSVAEGAATIVVKATDAAIYLVFGVTVATSAAETAVLEDAMAAVGRGLLASAGSTIGERLEMTDASSSDDWGGRGMAPASAVAWSQWSALEGADHWGSPPGYGRWGMDDPYLQGSTGYTPAQWLQGARFEMPLRGFGNPVSSLAVWGAGDWHAFEGEGDDGLYDGSLTSAYLGVDARGRRLGRGRVDLPGHGRCILRIWGCRRRKGPPGDAIECDPSVRPVGIPRPREDVGDPGFRYRGSDRGARGPGGRARTRRTIHANGAWRNTVFLRTVRWVRSRRPGRCRIRATRDGRRPAGGPGVGGGRAAVTDRRGSVASDGPSGYSGIAVHQCGGPLRRRRWCHWRRRGIGGRLPLPGLGGQPGGERADAGNARRRELLGGRRESDTGHWSGFQKGLPTAAVAAMGRRCGGHGHLQVPGPSVRGCPSPRESGLGSRYPRQLWLRHVAATGYDHAVRGGVDLSREAYRRARVGVSYELASAILGLPHRLEISGESAESDRHGTVLRFLLTGQAHF